MPGAVKRPVEETVPPVDVQVTAVFVEPVTVALNCCVESVRVEAEFGVIVTAIGAGWVLTVTEADADLVLSATLVAVTV